MMSLTFGALAQEKQNLDHGKHKSKHHRKHISKDLNLTDEQKQQLKGINENHRKQMAELKKNESISVKEMNDRKALLAKEHRSAMEQILTTEQKTKMLEQRNRSKQKHGQMQAKRMEEMKEKLALTEDQSAKLTSLNEGYRSKFESLKKNESLDQTAKREQFKALQKQRKEELKNVLTQEQIQKLEDMKKDESGREEAK